MKLLKAILHSPYLFVLFYSTKGEPTAFRIDSQRIASAILATIALMACFALGTLLFFRQLETTRALRLKLVDQEVRAMLTPERRPIVEPQAVTTLTEAVKPPMIEVAAAPVTASPIRAQISNLDSECVDGDCKVTLALLPTGSGVASGELILVMEAEIPRIGAQATPTFQKRIRYFVYPGIHSRDSWNENSWSEFSGKPYRFSKALQTAAQFQLEKTLSPLAIHVYLLDSERHLVQHLRRPLEED